MIISRPPTHKTLVRDHRVAGTLAVSKRTCIFGFVPTQYWQRPLYQSLLTPQSALWAFDNSIEGGGAFYETIVTRQWVHKLCVCVCFVSVYTFTHIHTRSYNTIGKPGAKYHSIDSLCVIVRLAPQTPSSSSSNTAGYLIAAVRPCSTNTSQSRGIVQFIVRCVWLRNSHSYLQLVNALLVFVIYSAAEIGFL